MGQADTLSRLVLRTSAPKKVENALMVVGSDAPPVIGNLENREIELGPAPNRDVAGNSGFEVFECVIDQVGKDLFQRETIAGDFGKRPDANLRLCFASLMRKRRHDGFDQFARLDPHWLEFAP